MVSVPVLLQPVLDAVDARELAEFYRQLFTLRYRKGDEPTSCEADSADWLVLLDGQGWRVIAFQQTEQHTPTTWPSPEVLMQAHLDFTVPDRESLTAAHVGALDLGARLINDESDDPDKPLYAYADPAGHPFCIFIG